jgi:Spy/CpxP family protein refolding chaperone
MKFTLMEKKMKRLILILFIGLFTQASFAESGKNCGPSGKLTQGLDLQEEQVEVVQQIMEEQHEKRREVFQSSRDSIKEKMNVLHEETKSKLSSILTEEQMIKFEESHAKRMAKREQRHEKRKEKFRKVSQAIDNESDESI